MDILLAEWVLSGIIFINRNDLGWRDAPSAYGPHKTLYNRWKRWSDNGVFARIMVGLATERAEHKTIMIDATYLKAHRTASSLCVKKRGRGRQIGRTKGGMNTKLHAVADARGGQSGSSCRPARSATTLAQRRCWAAFRRWAGCWLTGDTTLTGLEKR